MNSFVRAIRRILARVWGVLGGGRRDDDVAREMSEHLAMATEENIRRGMPPDEAHRAALIESGGIEVAKESYRDQRSLPRIEALMRDFSFAWRGVRRSPGHAFPVMLSLALGIGLNTAIFTMAEGVLRRPLPYPDEAELMTVGKLVTGKTAEQSPSIDWELYDNDLNAWTAASRTVDGIAVYDDSYEVIEGNAGPEYAMGGTATANLLQVLRVQPLRGRWFRKEESRAHVVVISEELWAHQFASAEDVLGRILRVQDEPCTIIGVMPKGMGLPIGARYWTPAREMWGHAVFRPHAGMSTATIAAELTALSPTVANLGKRNLSVELFVKPLHEQLFGSARPALLLLSGAAALLFLIACANVASLSLARALDRRRELAVRVSLGAGRGSLTTLVLAENVLLAVAGASAGVAFAGWGSRIIVALAPADMIRARDITISPTAVGVAFVLAAVATVFVSLAPVLNITGAAPPSMLGRASATAGGGRRMQRARHALVASQLALTLLLMTGAGLLIRSVISLTRPDHLGFSSEDVVVGNVSLFWNRYREQGSRQAFTAQLSNRIRALPGIQSFAVGPAPLVAGAGSGVREGFNAIVTYSVSTNPDTRPSNVWVKHVDDGYLRTFQIHLESGRDFKANDDANAVPVAIVNASAARLFFPGRSPIGQAVPFKHFFGDDRPAPIVVGVIDDVLQRDVTMTANPEILVPAAQQSVASSIEFSVRTRSVGPTILALRQVLHEVDPSLAASRLEPMSAVVKTSLARHSFVLWMLVLFAALALVLSVIGLYAIVSYMVSQRTHEIGVRMALGAQRSHVFGLVIGEGAVLVTLGIVAGMASSFALSRVLASFLYGVEPRDVMTFTIGPFLLAAVAMLATFRPALRATRLDPAITLRAD